MRYDNLIHCYGDVKRVFDKSKRDFVNQEQYLGGFFANITDTGTDRTSQLFGDLNVQSKTVRTVEELPSCTFLQLDDTDTRYKILKAMHTLKSHTYVVSEVKHG